MSSPHVVSSPAAFDNALDEIHEVHNPVQQRRTPIITASAAMRLAILSNTTRVTTTPSPLPGFAELANLDTESASWFIDIASLENHNDPSPLTESTASSFPSPLALVADTINPEPRPQQIRVFVHHPGTPYLYHVLVAVGAKFWALLALDINNCLWRRMSRKLVGREPSKTLFSKVYQEAIDRQDTISGGVWDRATLTLDVPTLSDSALHPKDGLVVVERIVDTTPTNVDFMNALKASFTAGWVQFRTHCHKQAATVSSPHDYGNCVGILPDASKFTPKYRAQLKTLLNDRSLALGLLHQSPSLDDQPASQFAFFGNTALTNVIHAALYDPLYPGWFGFLKDQSDRWTPLEVATPCQAAQVVAWIVAYLEFQVQEAGKITDAQVAFEYSQSPATVHSVDNVGKTALQISNSFYFLRGGTGDASEMGRCTALVDLSKNAPGDYKRCSEAFEVFLRRPPHLPFASSVAAYESSCILFE